MRIKRDRRIWKDHFPPDWDTRLLSLWEEDDSCRAVGDESREYAYQAYERFTGQTYNRENRVAHADHGDFLVDLYDGGWWVGYGPGQDQVGVVVKVEGEVKAESPFTTEEIG